MYEIQKAKQELKKKAVESKLAVKSKIEKLKISAKSTRNDLRQLFKDMKYEYRHTKMVA